MTEDRRQNGIGESTLTVKWWAVILVFLGMFGVLYAGGMDREKRITTLEAQYTNIITSIADVRDAVKELRQDIKRTNR